MDGINRNRLRGIMAEKGLTIKALADEIEYSEVTLGNFLRGGNPSYGLIKAIVKALKLSPEDATQIFFGPELLNA